jgi:hypothetical protein
VSALASSSESELQAVIEALDRKDCQASACDFIERHCFFEEPDGTAVPFKLWPFQRDVVVALEAGEPVIVLKARRLGLSWLVLCFALWLAIFNQGTRILVLCKTEGDATELLDRIRRTLERIRSDPASQHILSRLERPAKERDAVKTLDVGASTIRALVGTPAAARSETAGLVIADEFAFQSRADEIWRALTPTIDGGGKLAVVSTGNGPDIGGGTGAEFASQWNRAVSGESTLTPFFFSWDSRPDRDEAWHKRTLAMLGDIERFKTEYPSKPADAFTSPDTDLVYDQTHLAAAVALGKQYDEGDYPAGPLWLGIDWGVNTHALLAYRTPGGGLYVFAEVFDNGRDLAVTTAAILRAIADTGQQAQYERFDAAEPVIHTEFRRQFKTAVGYNPRWGSIPFNKYKELAVKYATYLMRRSHAQEPSAVLAISPKGCPELIRQMSRLERTADGKVAKGDDHGADALLTLTAEPGEQFANVTVTD